MNVVNRVSLYIAICGKLSKDGLVDSGDIPAIASIAVRDATTIEESLDNLDRLIVTFYTGS